LLQQMADGPRSLNFLVESARYGSLTVQRIERLEAQRLVLRAGFTPTDALHVLGRFERWNAEASRLCAELLARQADLSAEALCERVVAGVSDRVTTALVSKVLSDEVALPNWEQEPSATALLSRALGNAAASDLGCRLTLRQPVVAVGAPVEAYLPRVARQLGTEMIIPPHADVANAIGAVAGGVVLQRRVLIQPVGTNEHVRLHLPDGVHDFSSVEESVAHARRVMSAALEAQAREAGADHIEVRMARQDQEASVQGAWGDKIYLGTELTFTAVGRPRHARIA